MQDTRTAGSWDEIRYFLAVARTGTVSAAARLLHIEHTTVSRHIQALENALGTPLFYKSNSGYELTASGRRLVATAEEMESSFLAGRATLGDHTHQIAGTVRIGAPDGFGAMFLAPRLRALTERHPALEVELLATARVFSLSKREAEIAISLSTPRQARVVSRRLTDYRLFVYGARAYLDAAAPIATPADLALHPFISYIEDLVYTPELNYIGALPVQVTPRIRSTNLLAQLQATLTGAGLCILPAFIAAQFPGLVPILPETIGLKRSFYMHIHEDNRKARHVREIADFISAAVERDQTLFHAPGHGG